MKAKAVFKIIFLVFSFLLPGAVSASAGWSGNATITSFYTLSETQAIVKLSNFSNPHGCLVNFGGDIVLNPTTQKAWFSMLWSAFLAGKTVNVYVSPNCTTIWSGTSYAHIGHVRVFAD